MSGSVVMVHGKSALSTSMVSERLGVVVSVAFLKAVGVTPACQVRNAVYWHADQIPHIAAAVSARICQNAVAS